MYMFINQAKFYTLLLLLWMCSYAEIKAQSDILVGSITLEEIIEADNVFQIYINRYQPHGSAIEYLQALDDSVSLKIFLGTWCRESKKYLPGLIKTLQVANSPHIDVNYIAVDTQKKFPEIFLKSFDIEYIPTVVVFRGSDEIGRIEEIPQDLIEMDLVKILSDKANTKIKKTLKNRDF